MPCDLCGEYYGNFYKELDIIVCDDCLKKIEEHRKIDGKFIVHRCSECHRVRAVKWVPYKKKGRKVGSENKPKYVKGQMVLFTEGQTGVAT